MTRYPVKMHIVLVANKEKQKDFTNGENLFGMFSVVIEIKYTQTAFFFPWPIRPIMYILQMNEFKKSDCLFRCCYNYMLSNEISS